MATMTTYRMWPFNPKTVEEIPSDDLSKYPLGYTQAQLFDIIYKYRRLALFLSFTTTDPVNAPSTLDFNYGLTYEDNTVPRAGSLLIEGDPAGSPSIDLVEQTSESALVLDLSMQLYASLVNVPPDDALAIIEFSLFSHPAKETDDPICYKIGDLFYPLAYCKVQDSDQREFSSYKWPGFTFECAGEFYIADSSVRGKIYTESGYDLDGELGLDVFQFWKYDPGDGGGAIWDEDTGAQLRDPFSVPA